MTRLPKYVCLKCGRGFSTKRSGDRHVNTVEQGKTYVTTEAEYRYFVQTGRIPPPAPKMMGQKSKRRDVTDIMADEFLKGFYREMGAIAAKNSANKKEFTDQINIFQAKLLYDVSKEVVKPDT